MPHGHDIVVIGGSAGAIDALLHLLRELPAALPARFYLCVHIPGGSTSALPAILSRAGHMPARHAATGDVSEPSILYVAPPDFHLVLKPGTARLVPGPRENGHRPAIDPLFRSAASVYGARVLAIVLSGNLDDGSAGSAAVAAAGGTVIVQDPDDAMYRGMPSNARAAVPHALSLPIRDIPAVIIRLLHASPVVAAPSNGTAAQDSPLDPVELDVPDSNEFSTSGVASGFTCPECHGGIFEMSTPGVPAFRCRVSHAFSADTLMAEQRSSLEAALWTAMRALEESAALSRRLIERAGNRGNQRASESYLRQAETYEQRARVVRNVLQFGLPGAGDADVFDSELASGQ